MVLVERSSQSVPVVYNNFRSDSIKAAKASLLALGSGIPQLHFVDLLAGFELFTRTGTALPEETVL